MSKQQLHFKVPTNFLSRSALRIEHLIAILKQASQAKDALIHRCAIKSLVDLMDIIEKPELKSRFLKEFIRVEYLLEKSHSVIEPRLVESLRHQIQYLNQFGGTFSQDLAQDPFLKDIKQIFQPGSKDCEFSSPQLQLWIDNPPDQRQKSFSNWYESLNDLEQAVSLYFDLLYATGFEDQIIAEDGYCHYSLSSKSHCHLLILTIHSTQKILPKIQLGHHGISLRLFDFHSMAAIKDSSIAIDILVCQI